MTTQHEANLINEDRRKQAANQQERLEAMGVIVHIAHYTGDNSFPTEYTFTHGAISATGPTFDLAWLDFTAQLLKLKARQA